MNTRQAYNIWAEQYDTNDNKTRDLEGAALRSALASLPFTRCLEIGCGTGKNTAWLQQNAEVTAVDLSEEMLAQARAKIRSGRVEFVQADITGDWTFLNGVYDLVTFSLVLEHIEDLDRILQQAAGSLQNGGHLYIGELHPFKQYSGSKARFDTAEGQVIVPCFNHNLSDFTGAAKKAGLQLLDIQEFFDDGDRSTLPRILTLTFRKP